MATSEICGFQVDTKIISEKEAAQIILDMLVANRKNKKIQCYLEHMARIRKRLAEQPRFTAELRPRALWTFLGENSSFVIARRPPVLSLTTPRPISREFPSE